MGYTEDKSNLLGLENQKKALLEENLLLINQNSDLKTNLLGQKKELKSLKCKLLRARVQIINQKEQLVSLRKLSESEQDKAKHHSYSMLIICLCVFLHSRLNMSFRQVSGCVQEFSNSFGLGLPVPCHESIRLWSLKLGYHQQILSYKNLESKELALIIDECFQLGEESILLILAVDLGLWNSHLDGERSLKHSDVEVVLVKSAKSWTGEDIDKELLGLKEKFAQSNTRVCYVTSDRGPAIMKSLTMSKLVSIWDCTHYCASFLEQHYKDNADFKELMSKLGMLRKKWKIGKNSGLIPPQLRAKSRYLNIFEVVKWAHSIALVIEKDTQIFSIEVKKELAFLTEYKDLIDELSLISEAIKYTGKILKNNGLSNETAAKVQKYLADNPSENPQFIRFKAYILSYMNLMQERCLEHKNILISSDVIESIFGKVKYRKRFLSYQANHQAIVLLPLFTKRTPQKEAKVALEKVTCEEIIQIIKQNLATSTRTIKQNFKQLLRRELG
jgi:hypothetical protein